MISFTLCLAFLIAGYFLYGGLIERIFGPDDRKTPAVAHPDGVDYTPLPRWKMFLIQFLNIAGVGPIFGAIMGAKFGTASFLWITLGSIFAGATHDYLAGMLSLRHNGASLPELIKHYLGNGTGQFMRFFGVVLMVLVGVVFVASPAALLDKLTPGASDKTLWIVVIFLYYILAAILPISKIIGKIYPIFAAAIIFMAVGFMGALIVHWPTNIPELWHGMPNTNPKGLPIFPIMFVSIACGAISGFHATQSPLMARCMTSERQGKSIFYGSMITEGIVGLVWAAAATYFFHSGPDNILVSDASVVVFDITRSWLGIAGSILAILGVVAAPITSGDTAFRSARLIIADALNFKQDKVRNRLSICIPLFIIAAGILIYSLKDAAGFEVIWRYFAWTNQTCAVFTLWTLSVYLAAKRNFSYIVTLIPAMFMTAVCSTYICVAPEGFGLPQIWGVGIGLGITVLLTVCYFIKRPRE